MTADELKQFVMSYASGCGLDPAVALVQLDRESAHFAQAVVYGPTTGTSGEKGVAQFMPATWARFGSGPHNNAYDPALSMQAYCGYMSYLLGMFGGDYRKALQGYNGGEGNVQRGTVSTRARNYADEILAQAQSAGPSLPSPDSASSGGLGLTSTPILLFALLGLGAVFFLRD